MAVAGALFTLECVALYERRWALPELLASRSVQDPIRGLFVMPEVAVPAVWSHSPTTTESRSSGRGACSRATVSPPMGAGASSGPSTSSSPATGRPRGVSSEGGCWRSRSQRRR